jgi:hypothetical protein
MRHTKHRFRALGLCLTAALGLVALSAVAAQAEVGSRWMVGGPNIETGKVGTKKVLGSIDGTNFPKLLSTLPGGAAIGVECRVFEVENGSLLENEGKTKGTLRFSNCFVYVNNVLEPKCMVAEPIIAKVKGLIVLRAGSGAEGFVLFSPQGTNFTEIEFLPVAGQICTLPEELIAITGSAVARDCNNAFRTEALTHLIEQITTTGDQLKFGLNNASLDGSVNLRLESDELWSGLPA